MSAAVHGIGWMPTAEADTIQLIPVISSPAFPSAERAAATAIDNCVSLLPSGILCLIFPLNSTVSDGT